jgi:uncharacterized protein
MNIPNLEAIEALHRRYAPNDLVYNLVYDHCTIVADIADWCADNSPKPIQRELLRAACLLHDIATYVYFDDQAVIADNRL